MIQPPGSPRSLRPVNLAVWLVVALAVSLGLGCLAAIVQERYAPLLLFPLLLGLVCGAILAWLARVLQVGHRLAVKLGSALAVFACVLGLHGYSYRAAVARAHERADEQAAKQAQLLALQPEFARVAIPQPPSSLGQFLSEQATAGRSLPFGIKLEGAGVWGMWGFETLIMLCAALTVVIPAMRGPYCDRCRTWYRGIRRGMLSRSTSDLVRGWCQLPAENLVLEYRLLDCASGCGPTGLELSWPVTPGERSVVPAGGLRLWLSEAQRRELAPLLDEDSRRSTPAVGAVEGHGSGSGARSEPPKQA